MMVVAAPPPRGTPAVRRAGGGGRTEQLFRGGDHRGYTYYPDLQRAA